MNIILKFVLFPMIVMLIQCANHDLAGPTEEGNGSETVARGIIVDTNGAPVAGVPVQLLPTTYDPVRHETLPAHWRTLSNSKGEYHLDSISAGTYDIEAGSISVGQKALVRDIKITGMKADVFVDTGTLQKMGTILIQLTGVMPRVGDYVYLPGTSTFTVVTARDSAAGHTVLNDVPTGTFTDLIYTNATNSQNTNLLRGPLTVHSGDTVASAFSEWNYTGKIFLNTSSSGADIRGNVYDVPVLVRLNDATFNFSQAQAGGGDVRFVKSSGLLLPYEIERWDAAGRQAEIWVKMDTIYGNNSMQFVTMYWGNANATGSSNSIAVFDTTLGFQGVWHLSNSAGSIPDATANRYRGTVNGNQLQVASDIVHGQLFDGSGDYTDMGNVCNPDTSGFTVCAWIKIGAPGKRQTIISKSLGGPPSSSYGWLVTLDESNAIQAFVATDSVEWGESRTLVLTSNASINDTVWHHVAVVIDRSGNDNCRIYIDGADVTIAPARGDITIIGPVVNSVPLRLGSSAIGLTQLSGSLDECSVAFRVRQPDWVKLSYMNQRRDDKLIVFK